MKTKQEKPCEIEQENPEFNETSYTHIPTKVYKDGSIEKLDWEKEEWGGWKIVSDMLNHPDKNGIYSTSECYQKLYNFVVAQKEKTEQLSYEKGREDERNKKLQ